MQRRKVQVLIFRLDKLNKKYFLILRTNKKRGHFSQIVTGGVDNKETYLQAAIREMHEETGIRYSDIEKSYRPKLKFRFKDQWNSNVKEWSFIFQTNKKDILIDPSEHENYEWISEDQIMRSHVKFKSNFLPIKWVLNEL